ncbi:efflux RND transporter periplasmic adaptor subunit [uncultured Selenomonas sp.]|uniref:efflux RND transporter periplasmic adaptor subunit n=1 Tax=uncultured Selenomonas sp. TaxID=159275 RepID=UPI0025E6B21C|nr:efflux RND transporter periplasmic adaptor subunit [uncultured Selenomonas sp.]
MTFAAGCGKDAAVETKPPLVRSMVVGVDAGASSDTYAGTVRGRYETNLSFQVGGQILARNVNVGDRVAAGDVLMVIDAKDVVQKANQGDAAVASARAQLNLAQSNLARYSELYNEAAVPAAVLDQYQTQYDAAFAAYQNALAEAAQGHNALGYTNLMAGADGVISAVNAEEGQVVAAGQTVATLVQTGELEVEINVPENHLSDVAVGKAVDVEFWALKGSVTGTVREIAPMADSAARTYKVRISIPAPPAGMELGMTASVHVTGATAGDAGYLVPLAAIYQTGDAPEVWVVGDDGTVDLQPVTVEQFDANQVRVHGVAAGTTIVTAGVHKLRTGQEVRTK